MMKEITEKYQWMHNIMNYNEGKALKNSFSLLGHQ